MASQFWQPTTISLLLGLVLTPCARMFARSIGMTAPVRADRWHAKPTALLGGVAIVLATILPACWFITWDVSSMVLLGSVAMASLVGLVDDILHISARKKLLGQLLAAALFMLGGGICPLTPWIWLNVPITLFWLIGITNSLNLLDNMDGLSAGTAGIISAGLIFMLGRIGGDSDAIFLCCLLGAAFAFLVFNKHPSTIFMGDCGSLFLGFSLASTAVRVGQHEHTQPFAIACLMLLFFGLPIFDTTLVTVLRTLSGTPISQGGRDHSSHRLVRMGFSEKNAVILLYLIAGAGMVAGITTYSEGTLWLYTALGAYLLFLLLFAFRLAAVNTEAKTPGKSETCETPQPESQT